MHLAEKALALADRKRPDHGGVIDERMVVGGDAAVGLPIVDVLHRLRVIAAEVAAVAADECLLGDVDGLRPEEGFEQIEPLRETLLHLAIIVQPPRT